MPQFYSMQLSVRRWLTHRVLKCALAVALLVLFGCGDGVIIFFRTNLGTIEEDAACTPGGGQFPLREQQGLVVLVVLDGDSAVVLANGAAGTCHDLRAGIPVSVRGTDDHGHVRASEVDILGK